MPNASTAWPAAEWSSLVVGHFHHDHRRGDRRLHDAGEIATMPSNTTAPAGADGRRCASQPPRPAPTDSEGAKIPPGMPLRYETTVAASFRTEEPRKARRCPPRSARLRIAGAVGRPPGRPAEQRQQQPADRANTSGWRITSGRASAGGRARRRQQPLNTPPASPPATPQTSTAIQPGPNVRFAEVCAEIRCSCRPARAW